ncbi:MAG: hypothetical protein Q9181_006735 [Wetmoreana brouardii]
MSSLILGRDLEKLCHHHAKREDFSTLDEAYYCNLDKVYSWIDYLKKPQEPEPRSIPNLTHEGVEGQDLVPDIHSGMIKGLAAIRQMLDIEPSERPAAKGLWERFQFVSSRICRDCDPRLPDEIWTPNPRQKNAADSGASRRRLMHLGREEGSDNPSTETIDGQTDNENMLSTNSRSDRNRLTEQRGSSAHNGRKLASSSTFLNPSSTHTSSQNPGYHEPSNPGVVPSSTEDEKLSGIQISVLCEAQTVLRKPSANPAGFKVP